MPFKDVPPTPDFPAQERETLNWWQQNKSFEKLRAMQKGRPKWSFMDGPITANNPMGVHHAWGRTYKDVFNRFWAMRGRELRYQQGFDCQGLWVEVEVEKEMGFKSKRDIEAYGMAAFVNKCKERVLRFSAVQTEQSVRLGYWMDWNDPDQLRWLAEKIITDPAEVVTVEGPEGPVTDTVENIVGRLGLPEMGGSYYTLSNENNYMIWRALKICHDNGWLYRGADVMPWCPRCATGISQHEIVTDGYAEITHRSVTLKFPLRDKPGETSTSVASTGVASTGVASTGVASTGVASTGVASTGVASTGVASTGVASTGVASTGVASTGVASTGVASTGVASTGVASTGVASTGVASTGVASTGVASTGVASTGVASTGVASTGVASTGVASTGVASTGVASTGVASTGVASTGVASTGVASTGVASTGVASTGVASTGVASTGVASTGVASTGVASTGSAREYLLVWTTTPWTLTSNVAAAVGPELTYVKVKMMLTDEILYLSKGATSTLRGKYEVLAELKGADMLGWTYDGPFDELPAAQAPGGWTHLKEMIAGIPVSAKEAHRVIFWDEVSEEEGTGIVHIAPGAGAEDFVLGKENNLPIVAPLDDESVFVDGFGWLTGKSVADVPELIFKNLEEKGLMYHVEKYTHRYPTCWRCKTELVFRLVDEWFISVDELRPLLMDITRQIRWVPSFGLERELDWLRNMHDWMISKKRYWGLALPIWQCDSCDHWTVVGDDLELKERAVAGYEEFAGHTPHRPWIDAVKLKCEKCGSLMTRLPDVGNPWLDAGIVSFSTLRYRQDPDYWRKWYPADLITESFPGQFRNWFYSMLVMGAIIDKSPSFMENFGYATLWAEDGRPMHKSWGNMIQFHEAADKMGVDVMRWAYCNHKPEQNLIFGYHRADAVRRQFLIPLWNVYNFFITYAKLDGWTPEPGQAANGKLQVSNTLDRWIVARLNQIIVAVTEDIANYDCYGATLVLQEFIEDLTNWYIRRSRRRFWKSEHDADKNTAYATLYHVLTTLIRVLAPLTPFVTEVMYQNLVRGVDESAPESVHHCAWPEADEAVIDQALLDQMALARQIAGLGLGARGSANIKVRQPLAQALVNVGGGRKATLSPELANIVKDELNVKSVEFVAEAGELVNYKILPNLKLLGPKMGKSLPALRQALAAADAREMALKVQTGENVTLTVDGQTVDLSPDELLIQTEPASGLSVAADKVITVGIDVVITDELATEGMAREVVRRIQNMRKDAGFDISDRITVYYQTEGALHRVFRDWGDYIKAETLAVDIKHQLIPEAAFQRKEKVDSLDVMLGVKREG